MERGELGAGGAGAYSSRLHVLLIFVVPNEG